MRDTHMLIDCDSCQVRGNACGDCMVTVLLGGPPARDQLGADEWAAIDVLTASGLVPPLRLVRAEDAGWSSEDADTPIAYGIAYRHTYGSVYGRTHRGEGGIARGADTG